MVLDEARVSKERGLLAFVVLLALFVAGCVDGKRTYPDDALDLVDGISGGSDLTCAHRQNETWCWGGSELVARPSGYAQRIDLPHVAAVTDGALQTCVRFDDRTVACSEAAHPMFDPSWPAGPSIAARERLWRVPGLEHVEQVGVGRLIDCARRAGGVVTCWGNNASGSVAPVRDLPPIAHLSVGDETALAIGEDGSAWVVGGEGSPPPWRVPDVSDAVEATSATSFHCLRRRAGTVSCFRIASAGRASFGGVQRTLLPVKGVEHATRLAAGGETACALAPNGLSCWGNDTVIVASPSLSWVDAALVVPRVDFDDLVVTAKAVCAHETKGHVYCRGLGPAVGDHGPDYLHEGYVRTGAAAEAERRRRVLICSIAAVLASLVAAFVARRVLRRASWTGAPVTVGAGYRASALPTTGGPPPRLIGAALYLGLMAVGADATFLVGVVVAREDYLFMIFIAVAVVLGLLFAAARILVAGARGSVAGLANWLIVGVFGLVGHGPLLIAQVDAGLDAPFARPVMVVATLGLVASLLVLLARRSISGGDSKPAA